jgi:hypothetical protein
MPKLTLRDLFAVVTILALILGWLVDHRRHSHLREENDHLRYALETLGNEVERYGVKVSVEHQRVTVSHTRTATELKEQ